MYFYFLVQTCCRLKTFLSNHNFFTLIRTAHSTLNDSLFPALVLMLESVYDCKGDLSKQSTDDILNQLKEVVSPKEKLVLWNQLSLAVFSRSALLITATSYLTAITHIQLGILAGYTQRASLLNSYQGSQTCSVPKQYDINRENLHIRSLAEDSQKAFLSKGTKVFITHGVAQIHQSLITEIIPKIMGQLKLSQLLTLSELSDVLRLIMRHLLSSGL